MFERILYNLFVITMSFYRTHLMLYVVCQQVWTKIFAAVVSIIVCTLGVWQSTHDAHGHIAQVLYGCCIFVVYKYGMLHTMFAK